MVEPPVETDWVPVALAPSPKAAKVPADMADSNPASNSEVILMVIMVRLQDESYLAFPASKGTRAIHAITGQRLSIGNGLRYPGARAQHGCYVQ
ncbi:hypothetical protein VD17_13545 [Pseudomonas fluorescens]|uniref:Uncharacterized protein n=1 Tax=Pseudomonas fluorescens TaxID=294 RepID=A0A0F4VBD8_PSEFL|nr:hypothetical protein VD17_13545 [Pseudomonas fluorescens]